MLCFHDTRHSTAELHTFLGAVMRRNGLEGRVMNLPIDLEGVLISEGGAGF